jgi:outer membrane protein TolC
MFYPLPALLLAAAPPLIVRTDTTVDALVVDALHGRPELASAASLIAAERERVTPAAALPDPTLLLGIQNDSFTHYSIGTMETSWYTIMATQAFPWPTKLRARSNVAGFSSRVAEAALHRVQLSVEAQVRRAYVELLLARDQLELLGRLEELWKRSEALARARYAVGDAPQSDLLRAQLGLTRLRQQRLALETAEHVSLAELNRARGHAVGDTVATTGDLEHLGEPAELEADPAREDAEQRSPELAAARLSAAEAGARHELAKAERFPDFSVGAGVMPRGQLEPMWQLTVGFTLPVYASLKQNRAVAEAAARSEASVSDEKSVRQLLELRTAQRSALLETAKKTNALYRDAILIQSEATATSTLAQYQVGKVPFASVLETLSGYLADRGAYLESLAEMHRISIAQFELSLDEPRSPRTSLSGGPAMSSGSSASAMPSTAKQPAAIGAQTQPSPMGGM